MDVLNLNSIVNYYIRKTTLIEYDLSAYITKHNDLCRIGHYNNTLFQWWVLLKCTTHQASEQQSRQQYKQK